LVFFGPFPPAKTAADVEKHREDVAALLRALEAMVVVDTMLMAIQRGAVQYAAIEDGNVGPSGDWIKSGKHFENK